MKYTVSVPVVSIVDVVVDAISKQDAIDLAFGIVSHADESDDIWDEMWGTNAHMYLYDELGNTIDVISARES